LERQIAEGGRYPAVNVLRSLSRTVPSCNAAEENALAQEARATLSTWDDIQDMVRLGAYRAGNDPVTDRAIRVAPAIENILKQSRNESATIAESFDALRGALSTSGTSR